MLFHDICPFRIGSKVKVREGTAYASDWRDSYIVTGIRWRYQTGDGTGIDVSIAKENEIEARDGDTDGFSPDDLLPV